MRPTSQVVVGDQRSSLPASPARQVLLALDLIGDSDLGEVVALVRSICGTDAAAISVLDGDAYRLATTSGIEPVRTAAADSLCIHTIGRHDTVVVEDTRSDPRMASSPHVDGRAGSIRFYASAPIYGPDQVMVGRLCVFDNAPKTLTALQLRTVTTLAANITKVLELRLLHETESRRDAPVTTDEALRFAAQISHDMRIPLTALTTSLEMLRQSPAAGDSDEHDETRSQLYATASRSADRISHMIEGLLELNDAGRKLVLDDVDVTKLAHQVASDVSPQLRDSDAELRIGRLPVVYADGDQLYSVLLNLVTNAVKFARPDVPPVVQLDSHRVAAGWRFCVTDNGRGIPAERREDVFAMFSRLDTAVQGHGLGLATVRRIVERHGGRVGVGDPEDTGCEIWFELPDLVG